MERSGLPGTLCGAGAETEPKMSEAILTFQVQLSGVMETVLKSAMYEITRLVEDSFLEEVARSKQEVESLRQRLQWWESRRREREGGGRARCADCGRAGVPREGAHITTPPAPPGAEGRSAAAFTKRCSEQEHSEQDTAPPAGQRLTEQQGRQRAGETCGFYTAGSQHCAGSGGHLDSERGAWTAFKLGDSDTETEGPGSSYTAEQKAASPSAGPAAEGAADSVSPLHCLSVKSEGDAPHSVAVKEEAEIQPVCGEEIRADLAHTRHRRHTEPWDTGDMQAERVGGRPNGLPHRRIRKTNAQRQREYRQRRSEEEVARDREQARMRMRKYRWRKKHGGEAALSTVAAQRGAQRPRREASAPGTSVHREISALSGGSVCSSASSPC
ncbi:uncharacterized protein LOC118769543 [Megalops cyprinoides]|uniref:uncharacterized protein LOC118769543 n=1 Tax=Megalops cyprinoides TaxID=118141 RepID=UPI0018652905|nr:uncharacterized protein LOC118769543 [Megalops cyprinoides]